MNPLKITLIRLPQTSVDRNRAANVQLIEKKANHL